MHEQIFIRQAAAFGIGMFAKQTKGKGKEAIQTAAAALLEALKFLYFVIIMY